MASFYFLQKSAFSKSRCQGTTANKIDQGVVLWPNVNRNMNWISPQMSLLFPGSLFLVGSVAHNHPIGTYFVLAFRGRQYATDSHLWKIHPQMVLRVGRDLLEKNSGWFFLGCKESCKIPSVIWVFYCFQYIPLFPGLNMKKPGFFIFVFKQNVGIGWYWMLWR